VSDMEEVKEKKSPQFGIQGEKRKKDRPQKKARDGPGKLDISRRKSREKKAWETSEEGLRADDGGLEQG